MRWTLVVVLILTPALGLGQSLGEVAKKERERREKNKQEGKKALVFSESEIFGEEGEAESAPETGVETPSRSSSVGERPVRERSESIEEGDVPSSIPPDLPLDEKLVMFERMKTHYESQVRQIDEEIAKNETRIRELDSEIRAASTSGGAGLPVAPSADVANRQFTGQESVTLVEEQQKLKTMNEHLQGQKERLKLNLQQQGRVAGIPPGYLRF
ncbi:MAG TPA: hypothetical protein VLK65_31510 [Vicinamibacteria bacterium]|nr:hypothetical protein [Vicinamibacteria bacterium]